MTHEEKLSRKLINMRVRLDESEFLAEMAEDDQTNDSNLIRRALRYYAENKLKKDVPPEIFEDKPGGNWVPGPRPKKDDRLTALDDQPALIPG